MPTRRAPTGAPARPPRRPPRRIASRPGGGIDAGVVELPAEYSVDADRDTRDDGERDSEGGDTERLRPGARKPAKRDGCGDAERAEESGVRDTFAAIRRCRSWMPGDDPVDRQDGQGPMPEKRICTSNGSRVLSAKKKAIHAAADVAFTQKSSRGR